MSVALVYPYAWCPPKVSEFCTEIALEVPCRSKVCFDIIGKDKHM